MFLYIRYKEDLVGLVVDEAPCVKLDELVSVLSSEFTNSAVQILKTLLEDMAIVPTSINITGNKTWEKNYRPY